MVIHLAGDRATCCASRQLAINNDRVLNMYQIIIMLVYEIG